MIKLVYTAIVLLALLLFYRFSGMKVLQRAPGKEFDDYHFLSENRTETEHYRIKRLAILAKMDYINYDSVTNTYVITTDEQPGRIYWKISNKGEVLDSIKGYYSLSQFGPFLMQDYYIDWLDKGDKTHRPYKDVNYSDLTEKQFLDYLAQAEAIHIDKESVIADNPMGYCYLKIGDGWTLIKSEKLGAELEYSFEGLHGEYIWKGRPFDKEKMRPRLETHEMEGVWVEDGKKHETPNFLLKKFSRISRSHKSFYDINNTSRAGWNGTGYFDFAYHKEIFHFKAYAFKYRGSSCHVEFLMSATKYHELDGPIFLYQHHFRSAKPPKETGMYMVLKK